LEKKNGLTDDSIKNDVLLRMPEFVPFEWVNPGEGSNDPEILILWLDESSLLVPTKPYGTPLDGIARIFQAITPETCKSGGVCESSRSENTGDDLLGDATLKGAKRSPIRPSFTIDYKVIGPSNSTALEAVAVELKNLARDDNGRAKLVKDRIEIYSPLASATFASMMEPVEAGKSSGRKGREKSVGFDNPTWPVIRTTATDNLLACAIVEELAKRGVQPGTNTPEGLAHVALIYEWDTIYGKQLPDEIETAANWYLNPLRQHKPCSEWVGERNQRYEWSHRYSYLRGLDGELPGKSPRRSTSATKATGDSANSGSAQSDGAAKDTAQSGDARAKSTAMRVERAEGDSQFDYLRRIADRIDRSNEMLREQNTPGGGGSIRAIGILGTDLYDKLLILQALKTKFPKVIFFTTDLDARQLHPAENAWARNLIVASSYGLQLSKDLQSTIPPFRDSYQTATFLTIRLALGKPITQALEQPSTDYHDKVMRDCLQPTKIRQWLALPRILEIGRTRAIDLSPSDLPATRSSHEDASVGDVKGPTPQGCADHVHPAPQAFFPVPQPETVSNAVWAVLLLAVLAGAASRRIRELLDFLSTPARAFSYLLAAALLWKVICLVQQVYGQGRDGEPWTWAEGVSIWPSEIIRLVALAAAIVFIFRIRHILEENRNKLARDFHLENVISLLTWKGLYEWLKASWRWLLAAPDNLAKALGSALRNDPPPPAAKNNAGPKYSWKQWKDWMNNAKDVWNRTKEWVNKKIVRPIRPPFDWYKEITIVCWTVKTKEKKEKVLVDDIWKEYQSRARFPIRIARMLPVIVLYLMIATLLIMIAPPNVPYRGATSVYIDNLIIRSTVVVFLVLLFLTLDAIRLCQVFTEHLNSGYTIWPRNTIDEFRERLGLTETAGESKDETLSPMGDWLSIRFIARHTEYVSRLIWYPFVVTMLLVVARSKLFANWDMPLALVGVFATSLIITLIGAYLLNQTAELVRKDTIDRLKQKLLRAKGEGPMERAIQIAQILDEVQTINQGAFLPFWQHPAVKAVLAAFGGVGGLSLLGYFLTMPN
jgi:hypothetical protein